MHVVLKICQTLLTCIDNSGASVVECVNVLKKKRPATIGTSPSSAYSAAVKIMTLIPVFYIGDRIIVVVQNLRAVGESASATSMANRVKRGDLRHAVVVRVKKEMQRSDGSIVRFGDNACVLINKAGDPVATRMHG